MNKHGHYPPFSIIVPFLMALVCDVTLRVTSHPEGVPDILNLLGLLYAVMGWRSAMPVPEGGGAMVLDRRAVASVVSGRIPDEVVAELSPQARVARLVVQILEARGLEVPDAVRTRIGDADQEQLARALQRAAGVQRAEDVLAEPGRESSATKGYPPEIRARGPGRADDTAELRRRLPPPLLFLLLPLSYFACTAPALVQQREALRLVTAAREVERQQGTSDHERHHARLCREAAVKADDEAHKSYPFLSAAAKAAAAAMQRDCAGLPAVNTADGGGAVPRDAGAALQDGGTAPHDGGTHAG